MIQLSDLISQRVLLRYSAKVRNGTLALQEAVMAGGTAGTAVEVRRACQDSAKLTLLSGSRYISVYMSLTGGGEGTGSWEGGYSGQFYT